MPRDLEQLLHDTAVEPSEPLETARVVARGLRRRRLRHGAAAAGSVAVLALGAMVAFEMVGVDQPPEVVGRPDTERPEVDHERDEDDELTGSEEDREPGTVALAEVEWPLLVADGDGVVRVDGDDHQRLWDGPAELALDDRRGGVVLQTDEGLQRLPAEAQQPAPPFAEADEQPQLHAVVEVNGRPAALFTRRSGQGEDEIETLYVRWLDDDAEGQLGTTGQYESGASGVTLVDGQLVLTNCHIDCWLLSVPFGADPDGPQATELIDQPEPIQGLAGHEHEQTVAYLHFSLHDPTRPDPVLWLHDLATDEREQIELPAPEDTEPRPLAEIDLAPDGTAALVHFRQHDQDTGRTLLIEDLQDPSPDVQWLDTTARVRFASSLDDA